MAGPSGGSMRKVPVVAALLTVLSVAACQRKQVATDDALKKDLDLAGSSEGLSLAPSGPSQKIESAIERGPQMPVTHSRVKAPHRISSPERTAPPLSITPVTAVTQTAPAPVPAVQRPRPVDVSYPAAASSPSPAAVPVSDSPDDDSWSGGGQPRRGSGAGAVIRGGAVEGDHCDPRPPEDRPPIAINSQIPTQTQMPTPGRF